MPDELGIAKAHCQCCFNLLARFLILAVHVKGPGVGIQRIDIVPAGKLSLGDFERLKRFVSIVRIIKISSRFELSPRLVSRSDFCSNSAKAFLASSLRPASRSASARSNKFSA